MDFSPDKLRTTTNCNAATHKPASQFSISWDVATLGFKDQSDALLHLLHRLADDLGRQPEGHRIAGSQSTASRAFSNLRIHMRSPHNLSMEHSQGSTATRLQTSFVGTLLVIVLAAAPLCDEWALSLSTVLETTHMHTHHTPTHAPNIHAHTPHTRARYYRCRNKKRCFSFLTLLRRSPLLLPLSMLVCGGLGVQQKTLSIFPVGISTIQAQH